MIDLFTSIESKKIKKDIVPGLIFIENYISDIIHDKLIIEIDKNIWSNELKRRVQHYGYKYNYKARSINHKMKVEDLPFWATEIGSKLCEDKYFKSPPDQLLVNEYFPGQGIADHIDCEPCFEDTVVSISLGSYTTMNFTRKSSKEKIPVILPPKSAVILKGESRFNWLHGIPARKSDKIKGIKKERTRRLSLTFRKVVLQN